MTTGYVLILAVLILGGMIATLGDRIGMKVGKARLSLFNLRPRQTATVVSVLTGSLISASTLGLLFAVSRQLRTGVFQLEQIQTDLAQAQADLDAATDQRAQVQAELDDARRQESRAQKRLQDINAALQLALERQQETEGQLLDTQAQLEQRQELLEQSKAQLLTTRDQLQTVSQAATRLEGEIDRLQTDRDAQIAQRDREIAQRQQRLSQLQAQQQVLEADVARLERQYLGLLRGNVAIGRNQVLAFLVIRFTDPQEVPRFANQLLEQVNRAVIREIAPDMDPNRQVVFISPGEVEGLIRRLQDGREYVVRVLSAANYIVGEPCVVAAVNPCIDIFIETAPNDLVYEAGQVLAAINVPIPTTSGQALVDEINRLAESIQFRARQDGLVTEILQIGDGRGDSLRQFLDTVQATNQSVRIQAIAANPIYVAGPLRVELVAIANGRIVAQTNPSLPGVQRLPIPLN
ncbi:MAG: DUF3084 domain-containing protein [Leptolyngbya sp.]|nr:DUF3084 domain-containing protein [Leptolyngbya sp.]